MAFLDETGLAELWSLIKAEDAKAPKVVVGTYVGTGTYGSSNPVTVNVGFAPKLFMVQQSYGYNGYSAYNPGQVWLRGAEYGSLDGEVQGYPAKLTWSDTGVSWYDTMSYGTGTAESVKADGQLNSSGQTYRYIAIG